MFTVVIPARYASTRLPGKPLLDIGGMPMIQHVWQRAVKSGAGQVIVATDETRIESECRKFGAHVELTAPEHPSGTERIIEVINRLALGDDAIVVNVQGDEPLIPASLITQVADNLSANSETAEAATLCERITDANKIFDPNVVKVVVDERGLALYFSRAPIPWDRNLFGQSPASADNDAAYFRHLGIYAYRAGYLRTYATLAPSPLEHIEKLEQLRILYHGGRIHVAEAMESAGPGVDTLKDLEHIRQLIGSGDRPTGAG